MSKITKGPWRLAHTSRVALSHKIETGTKRVIHLRGASDADAALISAAPEMLASLKRLLSIEEGALDSEAAAWDEAVFVIEKALGVP